MINMPKLLRIGVILIGAGVLSGYGMALFKWGPCGPSSIWGLVLMFAAMVCLGTGSLLVVAWLLKLVANRIQLSKASQSQ